MNADTYSKNFFNCISNQFLQNHLMLAMNPHNQIYNFIFEENGKPNQLTYQNIRALSIEKCYNEYSTNNNLQNICDRHIYSGGTIGKEYRDCYLEQIKGMVEFNKGMLPS